MSKPKKDKSVIYSEIKNRSIYIILAKLFFELATVESLSPDCLVQLKAFLGAMAQVST